VREREEEERERGRKYLKRERRISESSNLVSSHRFTMCDKSTFYLLLSILKFEVERERRRH
jgi:hypothetical protein